MQKNIGLNISVNNLLVIAVKQSTSKLCKNMTNYDKSILDWEVDVVEDSKLVINFNHPSIPEAKRNLTFNVTLRSKSELYNETKT